MAEIFFSVSILNKMTTFEELGLSTKLLNILGKLGFTTPTEIQQKAIPIALEGRDVIGSSATGSGKTLAFSLGVLEKIERGKGPQFLALTPTRELADQITKVVESVVKDYSLKVKEVYGGVSISGQIDRIPNSEIIIGTPGRILDHLNRGTLNLKNLKVLILDEADRMSDMGFLPDVEQIIKACPTERQTMLFSATITSDVNYISNKYMKNPEFVSVQSYVDPSKLRQFYYDVPRNLKFSLLVHLLRKESSKLVMVFCNTRMNSDMLATNLKRQGMNAVPIHGGLDQKKRTRLMQSFHEGDIHILVCTDVAARGLDIKGVSHVYNYDIPTNSTEYIHRVGRTARAGTEGMAVSVVSDRDYDNFRRVLQDDSLKIERLDVPTDIEVITIKFDRERRGGRDGGRGGRGYGGRDSRGDRGGRGGGYSRGGRDSGRNFSGGGRRDGRSSYGGRGGSSYGGRGGGRGHNPRSGGGSRRR